MKPSNRPRTILRVLALAGLVAVIAVVWRTSRWFDPSSADLVVDHPRIEPTGRSLKQGEAEEPARVAVPADDPPSPVAPLSQADERDPREATAQLAFQKLLDQFEGKELANPDWPGLTKKELVPMVVMMSVAAVMDAAGTSTPRIPGQVQDPFESGRYDCAFVFNQRNYRFRRGDYPIYDEYKGLVQLESARREAERAERMKAGLPTIESPVPPDWPEDFLERATQFAHAALALR